jgi:hypothetical protein
MECNRSLCDSVKWGMKNPSTLFLRVSESVEIDWGIGGVVTK